MSPGVSSVRTRDALNAEVASRSCRFGLAIADDIAVLAIDGMRLQVVIEQAGLGLAAEAIVRRLVRADEFFGEA